jgi:DNA-binding CsgD family transcriptional regulator
MQLHNLDANTAAPTCFVRALPSVIESIGRPEFALSMFNVTRRFAGAEGITAFIFKSGASPKVLLSEDVAGSKAASWARSEEYSAKYWRFDPATTILNDSSESLHYWVLTTELNDLQSFEYRNFYLSFPFTSRLSLINRRQEDSLTLNLYLGPKQNFSEDAIVRLSDSAELLMATLWRHHEAINLMKCSNPAITFRTRLKKVAPALSERELDVCSLIATGLTSEGIALELGVGLNTVLTYRKRAYARLLISSQNELMRHLM